jgi:Putative Actinobacterial Holin-X, holin superfamily III
MNSNHDPRSIPELLKTFANDLTTLLRQEMRLARTETTEKFSEMTGAIGLVAGAAVLAIPGLVLLLQAFAAMFVANGMQEHWALLLVSVFALVLGAILFLVGYGRIRGSNLAPDRTLHQIRRDAQVAKEQVR